MHDIVQELTEIENLAIMVSKYPNDIELKRQFYIRFQAVSPKIKEILPADDIKIKLDSLQKSIEEKRLQIEEVVAFLQQVKTIIKSLQQGLPLGITSREQLSMIKKAVMAALNNAVKLFEERFNEKLPDISDTKIYIVGSRARGISRDKKFAFSPGRDADFLIVGNGIFNAELMFVEKVDKSAAKKFRRNGFISGHNRRFVPPYLSEVAKNLAATFIGGDSNLFGKSNYVKVNFHIASPDSKKVIREFKIEC